MIKGLLLGLTFSAVLCLPAGFYTGWTVRAELTPVIRSHRFVEALLDR